MSRPERAAVHFSNAALSIFWMQMQCQTLCVTCQPSTLKPAGWDPKSCIGEGKEWVLLVLEASREWVPQFSHVHSLHKVFAPCKAHASTSISISTPKLLCAV